MRGPAGVVALFMYFFTPSCSFVVKLSADLYPSVKLIGLHHRDLVNCSSTFWTCSGETENARCFCMLMIVGGDQLELVYYLLYDME